MYLFYSQYSTSSKKILTMITEYQAEFSQLGLTAICIDNVNIRKKIVQSKKIEIKIVPCILLIRPEGIVEKFDGTTAFNWVENCIEMFNSKSNIREEPYITSQQNTIAPKPIKPVIKSVNKHVNKPVNKPVNKIKPNATNTSIEDLEYEGDVENFNEEIEESETSMEDESNNVNSRRQVSYENTDFGEKPEETRNVAKRVVKTVSSTSTSGKVDIMSAAQEMQKGRE